MTSTASMVSELCVSCGRPLDAEYCGHCGEQRPTGRDLRLRTFLARGVSDLFEIDSRGWRTFRALLFQPGLLTAEYVAGRRKPWLSPFQVFIICNLVFFVGLSFVQIEALTTTLASQAQLQPYSAFVREMLAARGAQTYPGGIEAYAHAYNFATEQYAKSLVLLLVPAVATVVALLRVKRREPFVKHLVFSLHLTAVLLLLLLLMGTLVHIAVAVFPASAQDVVSSDIAFSGFMLLLFSPWVYLGFLRAYAMRHATAALAAVALFFSLPVLLVGYRFLLFMIVVRSL